MNEWQPIETFGEDGVRTGRVLIYVPIAGIHIASLIGSLVYTWHAEGKTFLHEKPPDLSVATHWMLLPKPPKDAST